MSRLTLELADGTTEFRPGEPIRGQARWQLDEPQEAIEVRLFWYTEGKGERDVGGLETERAEGPGLEGSRGFNFEAPRAPHSFSGRLITLLWAVELVALPSGEAERVDIVVAPTGKEIRLAPADEIGTAGRPGDRSAVEGMTVEVPPAEAFDGSKPLEPS
jgi:hypothetical protein